MKMVIATHNKGKVVEFKRMLEPMGFEVVTAELSEPEETGTTFMENAFIKADAACKETGLPAVADDSGLCVDYLDGAPGIYSARFAQPGKRRLTVLEKLQGVPAEQRGAHFVSAVCCVFPNGDKIEAEGKCFGTIAFDSRGENGFGYDSIFEQEGRTFGEMTDEEKDNIIADHYDGPTDAKVIVIEWEDFACSHCQAFQTYAEKIKEDYKNRVLFIVRDFSLNYPNSVATLSAGNAVAKLGGNEAFWKMSEQLFKDEKWISQAVPTSERKALFEEYAKNAGVNIDDFNSLINNIANNGIEEKIDRDKRLGENMGVTGTPTWMVNGETVETLSESDIRAAIEAALQEAEGNSDESADATDES